MKCFMFRDLRDHFYIIPVFYNKYHFPPTMTQEMFHKPIQSVWGVKLKHISISWFVLWLNIIRILVVGNWAELEVWCWTMVRRKQNRKKKLIYLIFWARFIWLITIFLTSIFNIIFFFFIINIFTTFKLIFCSRN